MLILGALVSFAFIMLPFGTAKDVQVRVLSDTAVPLPSGGLFGATLLLYGAADEDALPGTGALACDVTDEQGGDVGSKVFPPSLLSAPGTRTVDGQVLRPLARVDKFDGGWLFTCAGPAARSAQPMYLLGDDQRPISRLVLASFGLTCLALGAGGLALARRDTAQPASSVSDS